MSHAGIAVRESVAPAAAATCAESWSGLTRCSAKRQAGGPGYTVAVRGGRTSSTSTPVGLRMMLRRRVRRHIKGEVRCMRSVTGESVVVG